MSELNFIILIAINVVGMLAAFWLGSRLASGEKVMPNRPGKLEVIEPEEPKDKYGEIEIWPLDKVTYEDQGDNN